MKMKGDHMNLAEKLRIFIYKHYKGLLKIAFASVLIALILYEGSDQILSIHPAATLQTIRSIPYGWLGLFFAAGLIASVSMVLYDVLGVKAFGYEINRKDLFTISFVSNSLNTLLGFGGLTGASIKTLLLKKRNLELKEMITYNAVLMTATTTGLSFLSLISILNYKSMAPILNQHKWLAVCLTGFAVYLFAYFFLDKLIKKFKNLPEELNVSKLRRLRAGLLGVSILEWLFASLLFYLLVSYFNHGQSFLNIMSVFAIASSAGIVSFIPGGVGSFDLIAVIGLQITGLAPSEALTCVILFRIFYYVAPSGTAIILFMMQILKKSEEKGYFIKSDVYGQLIATLMTIIVVACAVLLLISALTPSLISRSKLITNMESIVFLHYSRSVSIAIGLMLLVTAKEILFRVKRAYYATMLLLLAGGIFTFIKGFDIEEFLFLLISMGIMRLSKTNFYRKSVVRKTSHLIAAAAGALIYLIIHLKLSHVLFSSYIKSFHYPHHIFHDPQTFIHSGIISYSLFLIFIVIWYFKRARIEDDPLYQKYDRERVNQFFKKYKGHHLSDLIHLGDKQLFWSSDDQILIAYSRYSDKAVVLGDPIGEEGRISEGIQEFQSFIDSYGYRAVFYEVGEERLPMYHDFGYYFFKLGEEAVVDLHEFDMSGSSRRTFRNVLNRFEKDGYTFEVLSPPYKDSFLDNLKMVSDEWLGTRKEMGFSIGWFQKEYLQNVPIAVVRNSANEIIAFVSVMFQGQDQSEHAGVDLMRFRKEVPNSTMDFIFLRLLLYYKEQGYHYFSFGVAPLAKVGYTPRSHRVEKMAHFLYEHGKLIYSFECLRKFKDKFDPDWQPRYLAYPQVISLPALLLEVSMLVNKASSNGNREKK